MGGTERQLVELVRRSTRPDRHRVAVMSVPGALAPHLPVAPIRLGRIGRRPSDLPDDVRMLRSWRRALHDVRPDLVHAHLGLSEVVAAFATPRGVPIVASRRGFAGRYEGNPVFHLVEGLAHRRVRVMICNSRYLAHRTQSRDRSPPPIRVIHNAVDLDHFGVASFPTGPPSVTVVANLHPYKGHARLVAALRRIREELPEARMTFVGDGTERVRLQARAQDLRVEDALRFAGQVADPRPFVREAHVVALASDHEGFPNALLEAMAMGRPVVATRVGGVPELVRDGQDGFLTSLDAEDIAARLILLLRDGELRARMGLSARARAETFTWDRTVAETEAVYREVLTSARR
ncbi:MAG TPA: glycosyltransferase [Actinomycetota bacterium]